MKDNSKSVTSKEAKSLLKVSDCELAHMRISGKLPFTKEGNSFMYSKSSIEDYIWEKIKASPPKF